MKDVIIVGGGLKGMLTALFLHDAGLKVMVLDQNELGRESSWAGGGLVSPLYPWRSSDAVSVLAQYSQQHYPALCERMRDEVGIDPQWLRSGLLVTDTSEHAHAQRWAQTWGYELKQLSGSDLQACEPQLASTIPQALFLPALGQVRSPRLSAALRASLHQRPVLVSEHYPVTGLHVEKGQVAGVYLGSELFKAGKVVLAAGAWMGSFPQVQSAGIQVYSMLAESIMFRSHPGLLKRIVVHQNHYLIPRQDGRIVCGSVLDGGGLEKQITAEARTQLWELSCGLVPALQGLPVHNHWGSLLSFSMDNVPYIGEHPEIRGLYVNAGHGNHGIATGLASAQLLVDQIVGRTSFTDGKAYRLGR